MSAIRMFGDVDPLAPREINAKQIRYALNALNVRTAWEAQVPKLSQECQDWWNYSPTFLENNSKLVKLCGLVSITPKALFDQGVQE